MPQIGERVKLWPAPMPGGTLKRRVQDGAGGYGRFLPEGGAERVFDQFWFDRVSHGDVLLVDPASGYTPAQHA